MRSAVEEERIDAPSVLAPSSAQGKKFDLSASESRGRFALEGRMLRVPT
jgi:hypothetical protein